MGRAPRRARVSQGSLSPLCTGTRTAHALEVDRDQVGADDLQGAQRAQKRKPGVSVCVPLLDVSVASAGG